MALLFVVGAAGTCAVSGLAADTKPAPTIGFTFYETDTGRNYIADGAEWDLVLNPDYATAAQGATANSALQPGGALGTPSSGVATNLTGTAAGLTAGTVTTNANLTGHVTSTGNAAVLGSFTLAQLNTAISNADVASGGGTCTGTDSGTNTGDNATNSQYSGLAAQIASAASFKRTFALMGA